MKHTIKIDPIRALVVQPEGDQVAVTITALGAQIFRQLVTPDQAAVLAQAFEISAMQAQHKGAAA